MKVHLNSVDKDLVFNGLNMSGFISATPVLDEDFLALGVSGPIRIESRSNLSKKGVRTVEITVRAPLVDVLANTSKSEFVSLADTTSEFVQARLAVSIPNDSGLAGFSGSDLKTQADANARALSVVVETLLAIVAKQGTAAAPVLVAEQALVDQAGAGTEGAWLSASHPFVLGTAGVENPVVDGDYQIANAEAGA